MLHLMVDTHSLTESPLVAEEPSEPTPTASTCPQPPVPDPHFPVPDPLSIIEALLFASDVPLPPGRLAEIAGAKGLREIRDLVAELNQRYEQTNASFRIEEIAGGYQMLTLPLYHPYLAQLLRVRDEGRLSPAALETLAIIAYKQPILRADVESIRGVQCGEVINRLRELNLIKIVGRADDVGRPILYGTTKRFLEVFGLGSLDDLPNIEQLPPPPNPSPIPPAQPPADD
ncbi:MAG: Segregation and condensation protein B [Phycisphaerae bacterium]|nr:Segregation and condensation protein B [Phycisphaerae bacterium]